MRLSKNFTLQEYTKSQTATRKGLDNTPGEEHLAKAKSLFEKVVQPVRDKFGVTTINSGYRGPALNEAVGGSSRSQHCKGEAVDIECPGTSNYTVAKFIEDPEVQDGQIQFSSCVNQKYAYGLEDIVLGALEKQGLDFWWIDWQRKSTARPAGLY